MKNKGIELRWLCIEPGIWNSPDSDSVCVFNADVATVSVAVVPICIIGHTFIASSVLAIPVFGPDIIFNLT